QIAWPLRYEARRKRISHLGVRTVGSSRDNVAFRELGSYSAMPRGSHRRNLKASMEGSCCLYPHYSSCSRK
ncbi:hypothetical protein MPH_14142, partial [Macrophomina phaseolina MS6]